MKQGWEIKKLGEVCDIINGFAFKSNLFTDEGEYILRISNIQNGYIDLTDIAHFNKTDYPKVNLEKYAVLEDDIVVALSGATTGKFGINKTGQKLYLNQRVAICRENTSKLNHLYLLFYLRMQAKSFLESAEGVAQPNLSTELMKQIPIPVPPLPVQEQIVSKLDLLSSITEKKREQLKELDALAQSIFYDMFGDPITNEKGWEVKKLGEEFNISSGGTPDTKITHYWDGGNISWIGSNMCQNEIIYNNDGKYITDLGLSNSSAKVYQEGYVLVALVGATIGKTALLRFPTATNQNVAGINVPQNSEYTSEFIFCLIRNLYELFVSIGSGKFKMANLSFIRSLPLLSPPLPLQHQFASKIEAIERQKELIKQSISETETLFNARMQHYFN